MGRWWRALFAEAVATALLLWLGVGAMVPPASAAPAPAPVPLTHPALAFGFVIVGLLMGFGPASGAHMNPAVTLAALVQGRIAPAAAAAYCVAQVVGALLGFGALVAVAPASFAGAARGGCTAPAPGVTALGAAATEAALTALLALACCGAWAAHEAEPHRPDHAAPLKLGLVVAGLIYSGGAMTGASLNPARSLGPALIRGVWDSHWVYWVGPLGGAALAALLHRWVLTPPAPSPRAAPSAAPAEAHALETVPLSEKP